MITYDAAIATRNRPDALSLSIPLLLSQSRLPEKIIIVDSSDDALPVQSLVADLRKTTDIPITLINSKPGLPLQRNIALEHVDSDVVFFPDDDSLVLPGAIEAMMRIYERDQDGIVGGVCSAEATEAPPGILRTASTTYRMTPYEKFKQRTGKYRYAFERRFFLDPFLAHGRSRWSVHPAPNWLEMENAVLVEYMTGFRMSFRTEVIQKTGFHEPLGRYALFEDTDASFGVARTHLLVGARNAQIYHHKVPSARSSGRALGMMQILNRSYVILRWAEVNSNTISQIKRFSRYKIMQYLSAARSQFGRDRLAGALAAYRKLPELINAQNANLESVYNQIKDACIAPED